jgi:hypothetical protein
VVVQLKAKNSVLKKAVLEAKQQPPPPAPAPAASKAAAALGSEDPAVSALRVRYTRLLSVAPMLRLG